MQEMISNISVIKEVHINKCQILASYRVMATWNIQQRVGLIKIS